MTIINKIEIFDPSFTISVATVSGEGMLDMLGEDISVIEFTDQETATVEEHIKEFGTFYKFIASTGEWVMGREA